MKPIKTLLAVLLWTMFGFSVSAQPTYFNNAASVTNANEPFNTATDQRAQWLYLTTEFPTAHSSNITDVYFRTNATGSSTYSLSDVTILMGETTNTTIGTSWNGSLTSVYTATSATVTVLTGGWIKFTLPTPFAHDKTKNLIIEASCSSAGAGLTLAHNSASASGRLYGTLVTTTPSTDAALADFGFDLACPNITAQPAAATLCAGGNTLFGVDVTNTTSFQWQVNTGSGYAAVTNNTMYSGATTDTLRITGVTAGMSGYTYRCVTTRGTCDVNSNGAALTVNTSPVVTTPPASTHTCPSGTATFTVAATGAGLTYRWSVYDGVAPNWTNLFDLGVYSGTNTSTLTITGATPGMHNYVYRCQVSGTCTPAVYSSFGTLTIDTLPVVTLDPVDSVVCPTNNASFKIDAIGTNLAYRWQVDDGSGFVNVTNGGVYSGATTKTLLITSATKALDGYQYRCVVRGECLPRDTSTAATLTVNDIPKIVSHPAGITVCPGANTSFTALGTGTNVAYQWKVFDGTTVTDVVDGGVYSGATTSTLNITGATGAMDGNFYAVVISGKCSPSVMTNYGLLKVSTTLPILIQPDSTTTCENVSTSMVVYVNAASMNYQWEVSVGGGAFTPLVDGAQYDGVNNDTLDILTPALAMNGNKYRCVVNNNCSGNVSTDTVTLAVLAAPVITAQPANSRVCEAVNTTFSVTATGFAPTYQWQVDKGSGFSNIPNGLPYTGQFGPAMTVLGPVPAQNGYKYRCIVKGTCAPNDTSDVVTLNVDPKPFVSKQPEDLAICNGDNAFFGVVAGGYNITYQWQENTGTGYVNITNGGRYSGATSDTLRLSGPPVSMNGNNYRCVITGTCSPAKNSAEVVLHVNTPPTIYINPSNETACEKASTQFSVGVSTSGATPINYQWMVDDGTGFVAISNNSTYSGATSANLTVSNITIAMNGYQYKCDVSTPCSPDASSNTAVLSVDMLPKIVNQPFDVTICQTTGTTFAVIANGTGISYNWEVDMGGGFVSIPATPDYSGSNSPILVVNNVTTSMNGYKYHCVITGTCAVEKSAAAVLTVINAVTILSTSPAQSICEGSNVTLNVFASGSGLQYQWQKKDATGSYNNINNVPPFSGANTEKLLITNAPFSLDGATFRCRVFETATCNVGFYSDEIPFTVSPSPASTPSLLTTAFFSTATFTVAPGATAYQWQEDKNDGGGYRNLAESANYVGVNSNVLTISPVSFVMSGYKYRCTITGICAAPTLSKVSTLIVDPALSVSNVAKNSGLNMSVFPNPLSGTQLSVRFDKALKGNTEVRVMDKLGKLIYSGKLDINAQNTATIELQQLASGQYMLQVVNEAETIDQTVQFTKQ